MVIDGERYFDDVLYLDDDPCLKIDQPSGRRIYWFSDTGPEVLNDVFRNISYENVSYLPSEQSNYRNADDLDTALQEDPEHINVNILDPSKPRSIDDILEFRNHVTWREWHGGKESSFSLYPLKHPAVFKKLYDRTNPGLDAWTSDRIAETAIDRIRPGTED